MNVAGQVRAKSVEEMIRHKKLTCNFIDVLSGRRLYSRHLSGVFGFAIHGAVKYIQRGILCNEYCICRISSSIA